MPALMIQGTGSNVGKSLLVAGLCRAARRRGLSVAPFKPQNMSNNAAVTADGGEIGRAQALQALAAGLAPVVDMNPVLLKPEGETGSQIIVQGQRVATLRARDYGAFKPTLLPRVLESFARLSAKHDLVIVEGAGSPAEVNLRPGDIANMGFARAAGVPVVLAGDIDRGGVIAQMVGTQAVLDPADAAMIRGFVINKFRGDPRLFDDGYALITARTGWRGFGVLPYFADAMRLPAEDSQDLHRPHPRGGALRIVCLSLPRIANFDDLDPLAAEPGVELIMLRPGQPLPGDAALVILPGSKSTRADLAALRDSGWDIDLKAHIRRGGAVLGLCGGFQMLGISVRDPEGLEGAPGELAGLGFLEIVTVMQPQKRLGLVQAVHEASGKIFTGYEIHMGESFGPAPPFARIIPADIAFDSPPSRHSRESGNLLMPGAPAKQIPASAGMTSDGSLAMVAINGKPDGAVSPDGRVMGTYLHGLFTDDNFRADFLRRLGAQPSGQNYAAGVEDTLDALAAHIEAHLDVSGLLALAT